MKTTCILHFDVFTSQPGKGNPAGIVLLPEGLDSNAMQAIAASTDFNDTAFIIPSEVADFGIRYFSPRKEVDLCGHATIAAATAMRGAGLLQDSSVITFSLETKAGILPIRIESTPKGDALVTMGQAQSQFKKFNGNQNVLMEVVGVSEEDIHPSLPVIYGSTGR